MRLTRLTQRQHAIDNATNLSLRDKLHRFQQLGFRSHKRSEQRQVSIKNLPQIGARIEATRRSTRHQSPIVF